MKAFKLISLSIISLLLLSGCIKETIIRPEETRTLLLLCDFSEASDVVVRIKGSVSSAYPDVEIDYVQTPPFNIREAAYLLEVAAQSYPGGTYFVGIVDPGGTSQRIVFEATGKKRFLLPDNGLASRVLYYMSVKDLYEVENPLVLGGSNPEDLAFEKFYTEAALSMLADTPLSDFGSALADPVTFEIQDPVRNGRSILGEILFTDNFGNCITNIPDSLLIDFSQGDLLRISTAVDSFLTTFGFSYSSVPVGQNVAFFNSSRRLELAVNYGNLSERYLVGAGTPVQVRNGTARIGILQYNKTATSDSIVQGMKDPLSESGLNEGENVIYIERNALGDVVVLPNLVEEIVAEGIDIMVSVSTPASQAAVRGTPATIPMVFTIVTDPASAGILNQRLHVTGLSDATNYDQYLSFVKRLFPDLAVAGRIYNNQEANSVYAQQQLESLAPFYGISLITAVAETEDDIAETYQQTRNQGIEAILIIGDNTMTLAMESLISLSMPDNLPVIGGDTDNARNGALASISVDYESIAKNTGDLVMAVLRGVDPDSESIRRFSTNVIALNTDTAALLSYTFPADVLAEVRYIFP